MSLTLRSQGVNECSHSFSGFMKLSCLRFPKGVDALEVAALWLPLSLKEDMTG